MDEPSSGAASRNSWRGRALALAHIRWLRRTIIAIVTAILLFTILGFFIIPAVLRHVLKVQVAQNLARPVDVGVISFNPYTLRLEVDKLHVGDHDSPAPFVDLSHLHVRASWASLYHLAPVVREVALTQPQIHLVRTAPQQFNFSDLLNRSSAPPPPQPSKPFRFAVSNIQIMDGSVEFNDQVLKQRHQVANLDLGVPFIANLPSDVDVSVQPLLEMTVDGSPIRLTGKAKPFVATPESVLNLELNKLALPLYVGYAPVKLPLTIPSGTVSADLQIHFVKTDPEPSIAVAGSVTLDQLAVNDAAGAQLVGLNQLVVPLNDIEPLVSVFRVGAIKMDGLTINAVLNPDGTTNFTALSNIKPAPVGVPSNLPPTPAASVSPIAAGQGQAPAVTATAPSPMASSAMTASATPKALASPPGSAAQTAASPAMSVAPQATPTVPSTPVATITPAPSTPAATPTIAAATSQNFAAAAPAATASPESSPSAPPEHPLDFTLDSFALTNGKVNVNDRALPAPVQVALQAIQIGLNDFAIGPRAAPATYNFAGNLSTGGSLATKGTLDLVKSKSSSEVTVSSIDLPGLQGFAQTVLAGTIASGKLNAHASVQENFAPGHINVHVEPATVALDDFAVQYANSSDQPVKWKTLSTNIAQVDLNAQNATVSEVRSQGIQLDVHELRDGSFSLIALLRHPPAPPPSAKTTAEVRQARVQRRAQARQAIRQAERKAAIAPTGAPKWTYSVKSIALDQTGINFEDDTGKRPVKIALAPLNVHVQDVSDDLAKRIKLDLDGTVNQRGDFKVTGTAVPLPLKANLQVSTRRLDLTLANAYLGDKLNATIASAVLTMNASVDAAMVRDKLDLGYRGSATVGSVRMLDKVTGEDFARWTSFSANGIDARIGRGEPKVRIGGLALSNFYARIILNHDGRLNLKDITSNGSAAPTSLTREHGEPAAPTPVAITLATPTPTPAASSVPTPAAPAAVASPIPADITVEQTTLTGGKINWEDYFIQPNYKADLSDLGGHIGAIGTRTTAPADVNIHGQINETSPITITGSVNPLIPLPFIDIIAKADSVDLASMSAYSTKYTGYPIVKGSLTVDVHYLLQQNNLTAQNHIMLDQLTFGDKVTTPGAGNLPVRLAVAILKDSKGQINLDIPVSGSLADPQFSIGTVIWHAFSNILIKAVTAPFSLISSAFGGNGSQAVNYIAFKPGFATLGAGAKQQLDSIAKVLQAKPSLKIQLTGVVDPSVDRDGLREAALDLAMRQQKDAKDPANATIEPDEYDKYLYKAYKAADFTKPRDFVGLTKKLPSDEMKKLMLANVKVNDADLKHLAEARAQAVAAYLGTKIDLSRITIGTPQLDASGIKDGGKTTRVQLALE